MEKQTKMIQVCHVFERDSSKMHGGSVV